MEGKILRRMEIEAKQVKNLNKVFIPRIKLQKSIQKTNTIQSVDSTLVHYPKWI